LTKDDVWQHSVKFLRVSVITTGCFSSFRESLNAGFGFGFGFGFIGIPEN